MKKFLLTVVLGASAALVAQSTPAPPAQTSGTDAQANAQAQGGQKTIKDPAEFNAYMTATTLTDPAQKASALESFAQQYPSSVVKEDALEGAMAEYQKAGNAAKASQVATTLTQTNPNNVAALAVLVYGKRQAANQSQNPAQQQQLMADASALAQRGLTALQGRTKPPDTTDADFQKRQQIFSVIFNGAIGQAALLSKDYPSAQTHLLEAVKNNPNDVNDVYPLALAYLTAKPAAAPATAPGQAPPQDPVYDQAQLNGLWFIARAANLAPSVPQIANFGKGKYKAFHGSDEGWDQLLAQAKNTPLPPQGFTITKYIPPSPAEQAKKMIQEKPFTDMGFGEWIFILTNGSPEDANTIWDKIKGKMLKFQGRVTQPSSGSLGMAVTADGIEANKTEVQIAMKTPLRTPPAAGTDYQVEAVPESYTPNPFIMNMDQGAPIGSSAKKAPAKKTTTKKKSSK
jgi:hypothetical protein